MFKHTQHALEVSWTSPQTIYDTAVRFGHFWWPAAGPKRPGNGWKWRQPRGVTIVTLPDFTTLLYHQSAHGSHQVHCHWQQQQQQQQRGSSPRAGARWLGFLDRGRLVAPAHKTRPRLSSPLPNKLNPPLPPLHIQCAPSPPRPSAINQQPATSNEQRATSNEQPATSNQQPATICPWITPTSTAHRRCPMPRV